MNLLQKLLVDVLASMSERQINMLDQISCITNDSMKKEHIASLIKNAMQQQGMVSNSVADKITIGPYQVDMTLDDDLHLNIYVKSTDGTKIHDVGEDIGSHDECGYRFTTDNIESKYHKSLG